LSGVLAGRAVVPEPDNVLYGTITLGSVQMTAANTNIVIEARAQLDGPAIASYGLGALRSAGDFYSLRVSLESLAPVVSPSAAISGQLLYLVASDNGRPCAQATFTVMGRGQITRLDLVGAGAGQALHPADNNPPDSVLSINELVAYEVAWQTGAPWTAAPTNIPLNYVVRAGALWREGQGYYLDIDAGSPPACWVSTNGNSSFNALSNSAVSSLPATYVPGTPFSVTNLVTPAPGVAVYGVEDEPPAGWQVSSISGGGVFDAVNGKIKWGLFFDQMPRPLTYQLVAPSNETSVVFFTGQASFDGLVTLPLGGQRQAGPAAGLPRPFFQSLVWDHGLRFQVRGSPGQSLVLETSPDLSHWQTLSNILLGASAAQDFFDPAGTNRELFYRLRLGP
jgi:hypothetical protein